MGRSQRRMSPARFWEEFGPSRVGTVSLDALLASTRRQARHFRRHRTKGLSLNRTGPEAPRRQGPTRGAVDQTFKQSSRRSSILVSRDRVHCNTTSRQ